MYIDIHCTCNYHSENNFHNLMSTMLLSKHLLFQSLAWNQQIVRMEVIIPFFLK